MTVYKIFKYLAILIGLISLYFILRVLFAGNDVIVDSADLQSSIVSPFLYVGYIVLFLTILITIIFTLKGLFTGDVKETLISLGSMAAIVLIAYLLTDGEPYQMSDGTTLAAGTVHWISTGLVIFYILGIFALGSMLYGGIRKLTK